ncbi:MAG TPA: MerR family transcriptional regulator [Polyangia bacterium]|jgi:DNA-binding transcriptional MerR regulator|nr:MerR family transcriptional regulator [Polyangia bacterium]
MTKPKKLPGLTIYGLTEKTAIHRRTIYRWVRVGLLPKPTSRGRGVRYDAAFIERALTIRRLRREGHTLDQIRRQLAPPSSPPAAASPTSTAPPTDPTRLPSERWERLTLLPGLELSYRTDGGPVLQRLAAEIWKQFGAPPAG